MKNKEEKNEFPDLRINKVIKGGRKAIEEYLTVVTPLQFKTDISELKIAYANKQLAKDILMAMQVVLLAPSDEEMKQEQPKEKVDAEEKRDIQDKTE